MGTKLTRVSRGAKKLAAKKRILGIDKGQIWMAKDFHTLTKGELAVWYGVRDLLQARKASRQKR